MSNLGLTKAKIQQKDNRKQYSQTYVPRHNQKELVKEHGWFTIIFSFTVATAGVGLMLYKMFQ